MNLEALKTAVTSKTARQILLTKKHSPKILFVAGAVGVVGTVVLACRATLKLQDKLDKLDEDKMRAAARYSDVSGVDYENAARSLQIKTILDITKSYAPAVGLGLVSIAALTGSHIILDKRNTSLMAAYAGLDRAYKQYRKNVVHKYGADEDQKFAQGTRSVQVEEKTSDGKTAIRTIDATTGKHGASPYAVVFDERSRHFTKTPGMNANIVMMKQNYANDKLRLNGHIFLNEVYDLLDLPRTKAGAVVGWIYDPENKMHSGDNYVSFGVWEGHPEDVEAFVAGDDKYVMLDFNVDGVIYDLLDKI